MLHFTCGRIGSVGTCFQNLHVGILNLSDGFYTFGLHILEQLTGDLHLGTSYELLYAFGKVGIESLNHLLTIFVVGQPEGLLAIADSGNHIGDVASDGIGLCRRCIVGQSCTEFNGLGTGNLYHLCRGLITTARIWIWIRCWNIIATACQSEYANKGKRHNFENLFHNYVINNYYIKTSFLLVLFHRQMLGMKHQPILTSPYCISCRSLSVRMSICQVLL